MNTPITEPLQVVVEGASDQEFLTRLLVQRRIGGFQVACGVVPGQTRCAGEEGIKHRLKALDAFGALNPGSIKGIVIARDSDSNPDVSFQFVVDEIRETKLKLSVPKRLGDITGGDPHVAVITIPWIDQPGHLDTLLYESTRISHRDLTKENGPIESFCVSTEAHRVGWTEGNTAKFKLRCLLATQFRKDPGKALSYVLKSSTHCPFNFADPIFDRLAQFFVGFAAVAKG